MVIKHAPAGEQCKRLNAWRRSHGWTPSDASARLVEEGYAGGFCVYRFS